MVVNTYGDILDKVERDFDLVGEPFLTDDEKIGICNTVVQDAAAEIMHLGVEDEYFLTDNWAAPLNLVIGQSDYPLPADIYANKIRDMVYVNGDTIYNVRRLRRRNKGLVAARIKQNFKDSYYSYDIKNRSAGVGYKIVLLPTSREAGPYIYMEYIRELALIPLASAGSLAASRAVKVDIPEFYDFIFAEFKHQIAIKIPHPDVSLFENESLRLRTLMINTLTAQVEDDETEVQPDLSHYREHS